MFSCSKLRKRYKSKQIPKTKLRFTKKCRLNILFQLDITIFYYKNFISSPSARRAKRNHRKNRIPACKSNRTGRANPRTQETLRAAYANNPEKRIRSAEIAFVFTTICRNSVFCVLYSCRSAAGYFEEIVV